MKTTSYTTMGVPVSGQHQFPVTCPHRSFMGAKNIFVKQESRLDYMCKSWSSVTKHFKNGFINPFGAETYGIHLCGKSDKICSFYTVLQPLDCIFIKTFDPSYINIYIFWKILDCRLRNYTIFVLLYSLCFENWDVISWLEGQVKYAQGTTLCMTRRSSQVSIEGVKSFSQT